MRLLVFVVAVAACGAPPSPAAPTSSATTTAGSGSATAFVQAPARTLDGYWTGVLAGQLHVALVVHGDTAIFNSIDQESKMSVDKLTFDGTNVHFDIAAVHGHYDGKLAGDTIDGTWSQGAPMPLVLTRGTPPAAGAEPKAHPPAPIDAPVDVWVPKLPTALHADGRTHLVYELHIDNFSPTAVALERLDVMAGPRTLATFDHAALADMAIDKHAEVRGGGHTVVFVWVSVDGAPPAKLDHVLVTKLGDHELTSHAPSFAVAPTQPRVIAPPLKGSNWFAGNGPSNTSAHRRALIPVGGHARIAQRFAIDWVQVGDDKNTFSGDESKNASYHAYGQQALAVAAGTVVEVKDGIAENVPHQAPAVPITLDTVAGNHVVLDLGGGAFAMYAHFQPGSIKVKVGDKVKLGQVIGLVGNSGNSTEPHLHFQIMDAGSPLDAEGIPYAFGKLTAHKLGEPPQARTSSLPTDEELVDF
jgi:hypothetical protein